MGTGDQAGSMRQERFDARRRPVPSRLGVVASEGNQGFDGSPEPYRREGVRFEHCLDAEPVDGRGDDVPGHLAIGGAPAGRDPGHELGEQGAPFLVPALLLRAQVVVGGSAAPEGEPDLPLELAALIERKGLVQHVPQSVGTGPLEMRKHPFRGCPMHLAQSAHEDLALVLEVVGDPAGGAASHFRDAAHRRRVQPVGGDHLPRRVDQLGSPLVMVNNLGHAPNLPVT